MPETAVLFVEHLTVIDATFLDERRGLVGESWIVDLELEGRLDDQGMVFDFGVVKKAVKSVIDAGPDHTLIVPRDHPALAITTAAGANTIAFDFASSDRGVMSYKGPAASVTWLPGTRVTTAALTDLVRDRVIAAMPENVDAVRVTLRHEAIDGAFYHYTHGLPQHQGACSRIAHGHRSRLEIFVDDKRDAAEETFWAETFRDTYLAVKGQSIEAESSERIRLSYTAWDQATYWLELDKAHVTWLPAGVESTVEHIARHIAIETANRHPGQRVKARAFEGVWKGAVACVDTTKASSEDI